MKKNISFFVLIMLTSMTSTCKEHARSIHRYLWANYHQRAGNTHTASDWYSRLLKSSGSLYTYQGYLSHLYALNKHEDILALEPRITSLFENDPDIQLMFALSLKKVGKNNEADDRLIRLSQKFKDHGEIAFHTVETLISRQELDNAVAIIDCLLNNCTRKVNAFIFHFLKAQLCMQLGKVNQAHDSIVQCIEKHTGFDKGWLLYGIIKEQLGDIQAAVQGYSTYTQLIPAHNPQIEQHLIELQLMLNNNKVAKTPLERSLMYARRGMLDYAATIAQQGLELDANNNQLGFACISFLVASQKIDKAIDYLVQWAQQKDGSMWMDTLYRLHHYKTSPDKLIAAFKQLEQQKSLQTQAHCYLADLCLREKKSTEALSYLQKVTNASDLDSKQAAKAWYQLGIYYYHHDQTEKMIDALNKGIEKNNSFAPLHNLLSYHYATKGHDLTKAQHHVTIALKQAPKNPHILDTQALIWYKQKEFKRAAVLLEKIAQEIPHDAIVLLHKAKVAQHLGKSQEVRSLITQIKQYAHDQHELVAYQKFMTKHNL